MEGWTDGRTDGWMDGCCVIKAGGGAGEDAAPPQPCKPRIEEITGGGLKRHGRKGGRALVRPT